MNRWCRNSGSWMNDLGKRLAVVLGAITLGLVLAGVSTTANPSYESYRQWLWQQQRLVQQRKQQLENLERPAQERLSALRQKVAITEQQIKATEQSLQQAQKILKELSAQLKVAETNLAQQRQAARARLRYLGRQQRQRWWLILLASKDLQELSDRRRQLQRLYQRDQELLSNLQASVQRVQSKRQMVLAQENEVALVRQKLQAQKAYWQGEVAVQVKIIERLKSDRAAIEAAEQRLQQDSQQLQQLILAKSFPNSTIVIVSGTGKLQYPTYGTISSPFGWRIHPILGYEKFHNGIDFAAEVGTPIYAADTGTVLLADWYGGYGYTVIIAHGNDLTTLYGHCSELYVQAGQVVQKGQVIAAVGSTGLSTGPHLHFEVRVRGEPVDPALYL